MYTLLQHRHRNIRNLVIAALIRRTLSNTHMELKVRIDKLESNDRADTPQHRTRTEEAPVTAIPTPRNAFATR